MSYSIHEHKHRFAAWAASRAATVTGCRFSVKQGKAILESAGINQFLISPAQLPDPQNTDIAHCKWRMAVIASAQAQGVSFTHGVAAKLINMYFKAGFFCGGHDADPRVQALHPPIDSLILDELYYQNLGGLRLEWNEAGKIRWSNFTSEQYEHIITSIRRALGNEVPLWHVEQYWRGYQ